MKPEAADLQACAEIVAKGDPQRFRALMAAPLPARECLLPLYAFNVEVSRAPWVTAEPMIAQMRLQWWRDAVEEIGQGGPVRRHEVTTPLAAVLPPEAAPLLDALIAAREWDIFSEPFEDEAALEAYLSDTSANLLRAAALALGAGDAPALADLGYAHGLANYLLAIPQLEAAGRKPLVDGRAESVGVLAKAALARFTAARRQPIPAEAIPALLPLHDTAAILKKAAKAPQAVAQGALAPAPIASRLRLIKATTLGF